MEVETIEERFGFGGVEDAFVDFKRIRDARISLSSLREAINCMAEMAYEAEQVQAKLEDERAGAIRERDEEWDRRWETRHLVGQFPS